MQDVHQRLVGAHFLRNTDIWTFSAKAAEMIGDINHAHPFREGNGRVQLQFLKQLGEEAGHNIDLTKLSREQWIEASALANVGSCGAMNDQIRAAIVPTLEKTPPVADPAWERAIKNDEALRLRELQDQRVGQQKALEAIIKGIEKGGNNPVERDEKLRDFEEKCKRQLAEKMREQQERLDRLELLHKGPSSGRERG